MPVDPIFFMALTTMSSSIVFGIWQLRSVGKARAELRARRAGRHIR